MNDQDRARVNRLLNDLDERIQAKLPDGADDFRFDQFAIVAIANFTDPDGDAAESPIWCFETTRPHVQLGIIESVLLRLKARWLGT